MIRKAQPMTKKSYNTPIAVKNTTPATTPKMPTIMPDSANKPTDKIKKTMPITKPMKKSGIATPAVGAMPKIINSTKMADDLRNKIEARMKMAKKSIPKMPSEIKVQPVTKMPSIITKKPDVAKSDSKSTVKKKEKDQLLKKANGGRF